MMQYLSISNSKKVMRIFVSDGTPSSYKTIQNFLKLILDMFSTSKVMQTGTLVICKYVSVMYHAFM